MCTGFYMLKLRDDGFTLVELLLAIVIIGVITVPIGNVLIGFFKNADATSDRMVLSHDAQISAAYFAQDVAGVGKRDQNAAADASGNVPFLSSIQLDAVYSAGGFTCGTSSTPTAIIRFLSDDWDYSVNPAVVRTDIVAYYLVSTGADRSGATIGELHRMKCIASTSTSSDVVVAHYVNTATITATSLSCYNSASPPVAMSCDTATVPTQVNLSFSVTKPSVGAYPIKLSGQRRQT
jgi:prepilin-type N-terminal cleavage/methylation domain-containing protein